jgi:hypothetical protein
VQNPSKVSLWGSEELQSAMGSREVGDWAMWSMLESKWRNGAEEARAKVEQYEKFVDKRLKHDLVAAVGVLRAAENLC